MEKDTGVASYMNQRAVCMKYIASLIMTQLIALCVFFVLYALLQSELIPGRSIGVVRTIVRAASLIVTGVICVANLLGVLKIKSLALIYPDRYSVKGEKDVVNEAYPIAKEVLEVKLIVSALLMLSGILAWLIIRTVSNNSDMGEVFSHASMALLAGIALFIFIPAADRLVTYKDFLSEKSRSSLNLNPAMLTSGAVGIPIMFLIYYQWRYFGNNRNLAWVTFPAAVLLIMAIGFLAGIVRKSLDTDDSI